MFTEILLLNKLHSLPLLLLLFVVLKNTAGKYINHLEQMAIEEHSIFLFSKYLFQFYTLSEHNKRKTIIQIKNCSNFECVRMF